MPGGTRGPADNHLLGSLGWAFTGPGGSSGGRVAVSPGGETIAHRWVDTVRELSTQASQDARRRPRCPGGASTTFPPGPPFWVPELRLCSAHRWEGLAPQGRGVLPCLHQYSRWSGVQGRPGNFPEVIQGGKPEAHKLNCWLRKWLALLRTLRAASRPHAGLGNTALSTPPLVSVLSERSVTKRSCYWGFNFLIFFNL